MIGIITVALLMYSIKSRFNVYYPDKLAQQFHYLNVTGYIAFDMANYGYYPYGGEQLHGFAILGNQTNGCGTINDTLRQQRPFIIVHQGNCTFVSQSNNIQIAGGSMAIIISNEDEVENDFALANDGYGFQIHIPTVFIGGNDGIKLLDWINAQSTQTELPQMTIRFPVRHRNQSQIDVALALNERMSFKMLRSISTQMLKMQKEGSIILDVYYQIYTCKECHLNNYTQEVDNCLGGGRYCGLDTEEQANGSGKDLLFEVIRQTCLFKVNPGVYMQYVQNFDLQCFIVLEHIILKPSQYEWCSSSLLGFFDKIMNKSLTKQVNSCFVSSFNQSSNSNEGLQVVTYYTIQTNSILDKQFSFRRYSGMQGYPGVSINGRPYLGNLEGDYIMEAICESIAYISIGCVEFTQDQLNIENTDNFNNEWKIIAIVVILIIVCGTLMVILYKRMYLNSQYERIKSDVKKQTSGQVNQLVEQYIEFYEEKGNKNAKKNEISN